MNRELLKEYGIDYDKGLKNCMDNLPFYRKILSMFIEDDCFSRARAAYSDKKYNELFSCMHELKGICGNIAMTDLYNTVVPLVELLRRGDPPESEVERLFTATDREYVRVCRGISCVLAEPK